MTRRRRAIRSDAQAAMQNLEEQKRRRHMTEEERREAARVRAYYDIPQAVKDGVIEAAEAEGLTASAVASVFLADALRRYREQQLSFAELKSYSMSPRWDYTIEDPEILSVLRASEVSSEEVEK
jgi:hypothetical protein